MYIAPAPYISTKVINLVLERKNYGNRSAFGEVTGNIVESFDTTRAAFLRTLVAYFQRSE